MNKYKVRKGDLLIVGNKCCFVTKTTKGYVYYLHNSREGRSSKKNLWRVLDTNRNVHLSYSNKYKRRKQRRMRTLDLHGTKHSEVDEKLRMFLNFIELPCKIITGHSTTMKKIVESTVKEYGWTCHAESANNPGALIVVEKNK